MSDVAANASRPALYHTAVTIFALAVHRVHPTGYESCKKLVAAHTSQYTDGSNSVYRHLYVTTLTSFVLAVISIFRLFYDSYRYKSIRRDPNV